jgi:hypothetical protein
VRRAQHHYSNNSHAHRRLRVTGRPRAVVTRAKRISVVRWILRSGVCALSEVSMSNGRCAGSRRSIGLTTTRKKFSCCSDRCLALVSSATLLRQRYNYILFFSSCALAHILFFFSPLVQLSGEDDLHECTLTYYQLLQQYGSTYTLAACTFVCLHSPDSRIESILQGDS